MSEELNDLFVKFGNLCKKFGRNRSRRVRDVNGSQSLSKTNSRVSNSISDISMVDFRGRNETQPEHDDKKYRRKPIPFLSNSLRCIGLNPVSLYDRSSKSEREKHRIPDYANYDNSEESACNNYANISHTEGAPQMYLGLKGLKNLGNTCFMNTVIQCLSNTRWLVEYIRKDVYIKDINTSTSSMKGDLFKAFADVIKLLWSKDSSNTVVDMASLKIQIQIFAPTFTDYEQEDAQEFLRYLLEGLHEDIQDNTKPMCTETIRNRSDNEPAEESWLSYLRMNNSIIVDHFVGQLKSSLKCTHCGYCSVTFEAFWNLSLPIPQRPGPIRLSQCLYSFTRKELLVGSQQPTCSNCNKLQKCTKFLGIQKCPKILVIHLNRFCQTEKLIRKVNVRVQFPLKGLNMSKYMTDKLSPCRYNLYAISNHKGSITNGHYTSFCQHPYTGNWHKFNDTQVSSISSKSLVSGDAYVLFYEQEGMR